MKKLCTIYPAANGWIVRTADGTAAFEVMDSDPTEAAAFVRLLQYLNEQIGPMEDPWSADQVCVTVGPGHEYEPDDTEHRGLPTSTEDSDRG